jgi:transposase-like protein
MTEGFLDHRSHSRSEDEPEIRVGKEPAEKVVRDIRRATRRRYSAEDKIRIVLEGLRGEESIAELCRREGISQNLYYRRGIGGRDRWRPGERLRMSWQERLPWLRSAPRR